MMHQSLLILGAGQYGTVVSEIAQALGTFSEIAFLDDSNPQAIGKLADYAALRSRFTHAVVAIGDSRFRMLWLERLATAGYQIPVLAHPLAYISPSATIGKGSIVEPMAVVQSQVTVEDGCLVCSCAVLKHHCTVKSGCYIDCNSTVMPEAVVPAGTKVNGNTVYHSLPEIH